VSDRPALRPPPHGDPVVIVPPEPAIPYCRCTTSRPCTCTLAKSHVLARMPGSLWGGLGPAATDTCRDAAGECDGTCAR
jgi:hypothetical protein